MVRPERRVVPAGASPVRVSAGAPGSTLEPGGEIRPSQWLEAGVMEDGTVRQREGSEANHRGTDTRASRLGELFPDGECRPGVQQGGLVRGQELAPLAAPAGWAAADDARSIHRRSALRDGSAQVAGHGEIPGASHTQKIIVKPCAGERHARFERGN